MRLEAGSLTPKLVKMLRKTVGCPESPTVLSELFSFGKLDAAELVFLPLFGLYDIRVI